MVRYCVRVLSHHAAGGGALKFWVGGYPPSPPPPLAGWVGAKGVRRKKKCFFRLLDGWVGGWVGGTCMGAWVFQKSGWVGLSDSPPSQPFHVIKKNPVPCMPPMSHTRCVRACTCAFMWMLPSCLSPSTFF